MADNGTSRGTKGYVILMWLALPALLIFLVLASRSVVHYSQSGPNGSLDQIATLKVDAGNSGRLIPPTLFGVFFEVRCQIMFLGDDRIRIRSA